MKKAFGTYDIARICQVSPPTVGRWIEEGKLPSFTTGGGHRRVWQADLISFLNSHNIPVPAEVTAAPLDRILIADDEEVLRRVVRKAIMSAFPSAEILEATDGFDAGHKVGIFLPSLVI